MDISQNTGVLPCTQVSPVVVGAENLPPEGSKDWARPMLFVGNHGKMGFYDTPLLM